MKEASCLFIALPGDARLRTEPAQFPRPAWTHMNVFEKNREGASRTGRFGEEKKKLSPEGFSFPNLLLYNTS